MVQPKPMYNRIMEATTYSELQAIEDFRLLSQIRCHLPCKVLSVNYNTRTVSVEIQGKQDMGYGKYETFPILSDIPIIEPHCTNRAYIITPIKAGDTGLLEFMDFNTTNFSNDGNIEPTIDPALHSINSSVFINGYMPQSNVTQLYTPNPVLNNPILASGMIVSGNIDLYNRPQVGTSDGSIETVKSISFMLESGPYKGKEILIPTITQDGKEMTDDEAIEYYYKTGQHLGIFDTPDNCTNYAIALHEDQQAYYGNIGCPITIGLNNQTFTLSVNEAGQLNINAQEINIDATTINVNSKANINLNAPFVNTSGGLTVGNGTTASVSSNGKTMTFTKGILTNVE